MKKPIILKNDLNNELHEIFSPSNRQLNIKERNERQNCIENQDNLNTQKQFPENSQLNNKFLKQRNSGNESSIIMEKLNIMNNITSQ